MTEPLYANLARDLHAAITSGIHQPGSKLPGEHELAAMHSVSRATVRAALSLLEGNGLVERRRGAGTLVLEPRPPAGFGQSVLSMEELIHYARDTRRIVRSVENLVADKSVAASIGATPGSRWLRIASIRVDSARPRKPICASFAYIDEGLSEVRDHLADETSALCDLLSRNCGVHVKNIKQELQGAIIHDALAEQLYVLVGSPALRILRHYRDAAGWIFMITVSLHPADRFAYRMQLDRCEPG
ncbi:GntR family transcriptional regulator [Aurantimonas sp. C2-6-R+9]|uniref:GntR family transcriptional regulator n=1 Tax=unclassified Aurantimonas TaxID=2638230 RepID=UPI002E19CD11|nr:MULTISPECIES: GntR family transcriptional regulator [unclassified Aurantimonas]MEC5293418.1 GntR family transcriptional regulator [Aurantimonas sp. C2-3-R2]MEC5383579.1 GntR family transcriptional regulator [Aurantimonas sp. C2-6-R+9]MEC5414499.1 GntR family transcriptional regulator [Aurantimonas sp. C2-4-R8]